MDDGVIDSGVMKEFPHHHGVDTTADGQQHFSSRGQHLVAFKKLAEPCIHFLRVMVGAMRQIFRITSVALTMEGMGMNS